MGTLQSTPSRSHRQKETAVSDETSSVDLSDLIRQLEGVDSPTVVAVAPTTARLVVATDWTDAAVPLTLLRAFRAIVTSDSAIQLAFAVPHEPTESDASCVHALIDGVDGVGAARLLNGLEILSFAEAVEQPYDTAVVPNGDTGELITQVGGLIVRMHDLMRRLENGVEMASNVNRGNAEALRGRIAAFAGNP